MIAVLLAGSFMVATVGCEDDPAGSSDADALAKAVTFVRSCEAEAGSLLGNAFGDPLWYTCFADKNNGCDAIEQCLGEPPAAGVACDVSTGEIRCDGSEVVYCIDGLEYRSDCGSLGMTCGTNDALAPGMAMCLGTGDACEPSQTTRCDGSAVVTCSGGFEHRLDCAPYGEGFGCFEGTIEDAPAGYCGIDDACNPYDNVADACNDTTISFCNGGSMAALDCTELGFQGCEIDPSGAAICK